MFKILLSLFLFPSLSLSATAPSESQLFTKWAKVKKPTQGPSQSIGAYDAGCLLGAQKLLADGKGFALMRPSRKRNYSHPELQTFLQTLGEKLQEKKMPLLLVGDASPPRGGPMRSGHASHQTGLDVDLWLKMSEKRPTRGQRESWGAPSFVQGRKTLRKTWTKTQTDLIATALAIPSVNRIFVSPPIKRYFCDNYKDNEWLYKLRAWWGHEEHIHVRLNCPAENPNCTSQTPLNSTENGCGTELDWWYSKEADENWEKMRADRTPRAFPQLPEACQTLVN